MVINSGNYIRQEHYKSLRHTNHRSVIEMQFSFVTLKNLQSCTEATTDDQADGEDLKKALVEYVIAVHWYIN